MAKSKEKKHRQRSRNTCTFEGQDYPLVEDGLYEAAYAYYETSRNFSGKHTDPKKARGGKLYLWFTLDPYNNKQRANTEPILAFFSINCKSVDVPCGRSGSFHVGRRSRWGKLCSKFKQQHQLLTEGCPDELTGKLLIVRTRTVTSDLKQQTHESHEKYSVIDELIELA